MSNGTRQVLVVDDEPTVGDALSLVLKSDGYAVRVTNGVQAALASAAQTAPHAAIVDLQLPDGEGLALTRALKARDPHVQVIIITAHGSVRKAMEATKGAGAFHFLEKPFDPAEILALLESAIAEQRAVVENPMWRRRLCERATEVEMLGQAPAMQMVFERLRAAADTEANILIVGETGTGKELAADALHGGSRRRGGPWIKVNCAALPKDLIESELFGHARGAFTGATAEKGGLLRQADGGSLFLDEITEMPMELQAKLLRVLEERRVRRLGSAQADPVDFRLISATNREPCEAVRDGRLRQDLYFRVNTLTIRIPPLRERREDIPLLIEAFIAHLQARYERPALRIDAEAFRHLLAYAWPGNVRELQHALEHAVLVAQGPVVTVPDLPEPLQAVSPDAGGTSRLLPSLIPVAPLAEVERAALLKALETTGWNKRAAAHLLNVRRPTLYAKMRRMGIPYQASGIHRNSRSS